MKITREIMWKAVYLMKLRFWQVEVLFNIFMGSCEILLIGKKNLFATLNLLWCLRREIWEWFQSMHAGILGTGSQVSQKNIEEHTLPNVAVPETKCTSLGTSKDSAQSEERNGSSHICMCFYAHWNLSIKWKNRNIFSSELKHFAPQQVLASPAKVYDLHIAVSLMDRFCALISSRVSKIGLTSPLQYSLGPHWPPR